MEQGPIELGSGLVGGQAGGQVGGQGGQGGQAAESDLTGGEEAARLCILGFGSLCATLATCLFTLELNKIQKLKTRKNKSTPSSILTSGLFDIVPLETGDRELPVSILKRCPCP